jgi:hypothetical protein
MTFTVEHNETMPPTMYEYFHAQFGSERNYHDLDLNAARITLS